MTTTNQTEIDTRTEIKPANPAPATNEADRDRALWEAYRLQQARRSCPTCGESCEAIY